MFNQQRKFAVSTRVCSANISEPFVFFYCVACSVMYVISIDDCRLDTLFGVLANADNNKIFNNDNVESFL